MVDRKLPGKQIWSGRRRASTRVSGFHSHKSATGGHYRTGKTTSFELKKGEKINIFFEFGEISSWLGFGGYLWHEGVIRLHFPRLPIKHYSRIHPSGCWSKFGSMWEPRDISYKPDQIEMVIEAVEDSMISFYNLQSGSIQHEHLDNARAKLLANMHQFSPEAHFFTNPSPAKLSGPRRISDQISILLKQCNRCARYLPINYDFNNPTAERYHLAFTNHCTAQHRIPCKHAGFGLLKSRSGEDDINLTYGFQLECRFCKKFEVNAAHNPQRTSAQMKEDGARRRHIEILLEHIYEGTPQLVYKEQYGSELSDDIWNNFNRKCFKCSKAINNPKDMHLDHTRPLMMLWPLDHTATCLCADCNIQKSGNPPSIFYSKKELNLLSELTGLDQSELLDQGPNEKVIDRLESRIDWFFDDFLQMDKMTKVHDGKVAGEQLVKSLAKAFSESKKARIDIVSEYDKRRLSF